MFDVVWLNIGSLALGLIAWILPVINLISGNKQENKIWITLLFISLSACASSIFFQIFYHYHLVKIEDWSALMDTIGSVTFVSAVLLIVTIILNVITLVVYHRKAVR
ncbi:cytochrome c oxidase subunit 4 [Salirhabdus euzebyi]|uniref:Cytochrome c oxidase subunit 4 n=1 Tax=Salirhabdus euzebyi TaxID=394506 RepID=A0A841Q176_9BACI|nr:hypothetical protein [Salirhabdus euzebyi]MBB6451662.1 cytochrome c oxidase subunit 4 [Salirhabdus euzebyi]